MRWIASRPEPQKAGSHGNPKNREGSSTATAYNSSVVRTNNTKRTEQNRARTIEGHSKEISRKNKSMLFVRKTTTEEEDRENILRLK